jgi:hypothetical protein
LSRHIISAICSADGALPASSGSSENVAEESGPMNHIENFEQLILQTTNTKKNPNTLIIVVFDDIVERMVSAK